MPAISHGSTILKESPDWSARGRGAHSFLTVQLFSRNHLIGRRSLVEVYDVLQVSYDALFFYLRFSPIV